MSGISLIECACAVAVTSASSVQLVALTVPSALSDHQNGWMASKKSGLASSVALPSAMSSFIQPQRWCDTLGAGGGVGVVGSLLAEDGGGLLVAPLPPVPPAAGSGFWAPPLSAGALALG